MQVHLAVQSFQDVDVDALVVPLFEDEKPANGPLANVDAALNGALSRAVDLKEITGKRYQMTLVFTEGRIKAPCVLIVGAGKMDEYSSEYARHVASAAIRHFRGRPASRVAYFVRSDRPAPADARTVVEGAIYGSFEPDEYKTRDREDLHVNELFLVGEGLSASAEIEQAITAGRITAEATNFARKLVNEPANKLTPADMVEHARSTAQEYGLEIEVLDRARMTELGMGGLLGVAQGSAKPPYFIILRYRPAQAGNATLALVGKGITFDSGGISIKPADKMEEMKTDMTGAASCLAAMRALAQLKPSVPVVAALPMTENMPGGNAMRPSDVLTTMSGKTIEVVNTDAEGRLILSDALAYVQQKEGATHIVDVATLTGACVVALGHQATGAMGTPQDWVEYVMNTGRESGEKMWQLPLYKEYEEQISSKIADVKNAGGRAAGTITAALFLKEFVQEGTRWVHLDIAGTAWTDTGTRFRPEGPTGIPVQTLINVAMRMT